MGRNQFIRWQRSSYLIVNFQLSHRFATSVTTFDAHIHCQVPRSICLPIAAAAEEEEKKESHSVDERGIFTKKEDVKEVKEEEVEEEEGEEEGTQWESFSSCQETLVTGRRRKVLITLMLTHLGIALLGGQI